MHFTVCLTLWGVLLSTLSYAANEENDGESFQRPSLAIKASPHTEIKKGDDARRAFTKIVTVEAVERRNTTPQEQEKSASS